MTDYAGGKFGGFTFPLTASTSDSLLKDADPSLYRVLEFFAFCIRHHLGARLLAESSVIQAPIQNAVMTKIPIDPAPFLTSNQFKFPLLAIHRMTGSYTDKTVHWRRLVSEWQVHYVLPPLTASQADRLLPILPAVGKVLSLRTELGMDPAYLPPGGTMGQSVWQMAGLDYIQLASERYGGFTAESEMYFPAFNATLQVAERQDIKASDFEAMTAADVAIDLHDKETDTVIPDVVVIRPPTT